MANGGDSGSSATRRNQPALIASTMVFPVTLLRLSQPHPLRPPPIPMSHNSALPRDIGSERRDTSPN